MKPIIIALAVLAALTGPARAGLLDGWKMYVIKDQITGTATFTGNYTYHSLEECVAAAASYYETKGSVYQSSFVVVGCAKVRWLR
jgi:hypothetical protein